MVGLGVNSREWLESETHYDAAHHHHQTHSVPVVPVCAGFVPATVPGMTAKDDVLTPTGTDLGCLFSHNRKDSHNFEMILQYINNSVPARHKSTTFPIIPGKEAGTKAAQNRHNRHRSLTIPILTRNGVVPANMYWIRIYIL